ATRHRRPGPDAAPAVAAADVRREATELLGAADLAGAPHRKARRGTRRLPGPLRRTAGAVAVPRYADRARPSGVGDRHRPGPWPGRVARTQTPRAGRDRPGGSERGRPDRGGHRRARGGPARRRPTAGRPGSRRSDRRLVRTGIRPYG